MNQIDDFVNRGSVSRWTLGIVIIFLAIIPSTLAILQKINETIGGIITGVFLLVGTLIAMSDIDTLIY